MTTTTRPASFPDRLAHAYTALTWAKNATTPIDPATAKQLQEWNPTRYQQCLDQVALIETAIPHLTAIYTTLHDRACWRCAGTGAYGGASGYHRRGVKYCFRCNGRGYDS